MKKYVAELIGTFVLVFGGCGAAVLAGSHIGFAGVAFAFGFSLLVMAYTIGPISGCHINPAVTFGLLLSGKFEAKDVPGYVIAQVAGAIIAPTICATTYPGTYFASNLPLRSKPNVTAGLIWHPDIGPIA